MSEVAFIVDGDLEKRFLANVCKGSPVRKVGNGDTCPAHIIAKQAASHIRLMNSRYRYVVILVDLEKRDITCAQFEDELTELIRNEVGKGVDFHVFVKDRCVEDWIIADQETIYSYVGDVFDFPNARGKGGLKKILKDFDIIYNETTVGVELLQKVHCSRAVERSNSLKNLRENFPVDCWWLAR